LESKDYKAKLKEMVRMDFPRHFKGKVKISGRSDLYTYFYIRSLHLLNEKGVHVFICSNSWLDVGYGVWLQYFLLKNIPMHFVMDNHAKRSFAGADVNTIITVMSAVSNPSQNGNGQKPKFVAFKRPFEEVILTENLLEIERSKETVANSQFRVFPITKQRLLEEGSEFKNPEDRKMGHGKYKGDKWGGKYLRAPDIFFTILEKGAGKLVKLKEVADVRRDITTGCNEFFYLTEEEAQKWDIEEEYLKPVIKSPRECKSILIDPDDLKYRVFMCHKDKDELEGTNALKYIEWGEQQEKKIKQGKNKGKVIKGFNNISSVKNRKRWYDLGKWDPPVGILPCGFGSIFRFFVNTENILPDKRLYLFNGNKQDLKMMNSSIFPMFLELGSRIGLGDGLLDLAVYEFQSINLISIKQNLPVIDREVDDIFTECGINPENNTPISEQEPNPKADRKELDNIVFDALGLSEEERKEVYRAVCRLVWNRIRKAKSV
jgi:adenine-specific DNA methylase